MARANLSRLGALPTTSLTLSEDLDLNRFWLWPNLLSLDAVGVAVLWQQLFANAAGIDLGLKERFALGLAVWIIYILDRVFDADRKEAAPSARHRFYCRYRSWAMAISQVALAIEVVICCNLDRHLALAGVILSCVVMLYFFCVHCRTRMSRLLPKELVVAVVFAAGTSLVNIARVGLTPRVGASLLLFAAVCFLNCAAIECWEFRWFKEGGGIELAEWTTWPVRHFGAIAVSVAMAAASLMLLTRAEELYGSLAITALALVWFDRSKFAMSPEQMRVAADLPLVLPALFLLARAYGF